MCPWFNIMYNILDRIFGRAHCHGAVRGCLVCPDPPSHPGGWRSDHQLWTAKSGAGDAMGVARAHLVWFPEHEMQNGRCTLGIGSQVVHNRVKSLCMRGCGFPWWLYVVLFFLFNFFAFITFLGCRTCRHRQKYVLVKRSPAAGNWESWGILPMELQTY